MLLLKVRESVVFIAYAIVALSGHSCFLWLTWPSRANQSFPYHVKTNHIGIASFEDDGADYPRHTYEPANDATIIIPLSRRTEDFITTNGSGIYNSSFVHDVNLNSGPMSVPQQCFPSKNISRRLPSPTNGPPTLINSNIYGNDILNDDDDDSIENSNNDVITKHEQTMDNKLSSFEIEARSSLRNGFSSRYSSQDNDSGHLSLDASTSPNSNDISTTPTDGSLQPQESRKLNSPPELASVFKENPFKIHSKAPSKIILDPIHLPTNLQTDGADPTLCSVPRHKNSP